MIATIGNDTTPEAPWQILAREFSCEHTQTRFTKYTQSNDVVIVREQCMRCGSSLGTVAKAKFDLNKLPQFDRSIAEKWCARREARRNQIGQQQEQLRLANLQEQTEQWWAGYNKYLRSQHWADIRKKVLERDNTLCQACLKNKATQAHHLSYGLYDRLGFSAAFELVAICHTCHSKIHPHMAQAQYNVTSSGYSPYLKTNGYK